MNWKFPRLTEISPIADRDLGQAGNIFSYECIFPAEWEIFSYRAGAKKMVRNHAMYRNNNSIIILITKNLKQLFFAMMLVKKAKFYVYSSSIEK